MIQANTLNEINSSLESKSWYICENFLSDNICQEIYEKNFNPANLNKLVQGRIGRFNGHQVENSIRSSKILWIDEYDEDKNYVLLRSIYSEFIKSINEYFFLAMKRFESQIAFYDKGDFYKIHLDQFLDQRHRHVSSIIYLNDCEEGGELVLYKKGSKEIIEQVIKPKRGTLVLFFSAHIYHEVKLVNSPRLSISTWLRDDIKLI